MQKKLFSVLTGLLLGLFAFVPMALAAGDGASGGADFRGFVALGAGLAIGLAGLGCGLGQGVAANGALQGVARNPSASNTIQTQLIISLALIESIAIYGFLVGILLWLKVPGL
jgi:F-type H+-transporting ATPase subunit c